MPGLQDFGDIVQLNASLAPFTYLKVGGTVEALAKPRTRAELGAIVKYCFDHRLPLRVLGGGCNVLVRDEGIPGVVLRLTEPAFASITVTGRKVKAGAGAGLSALISESARHGLAGLEMLVGIGGTVGGALRGNAGDRSGDIGSCVRQVEVMDERGQVEVRERDELTFSPGASNLDDPVLLDAELELETDDPDAIVKRMRKAWIQRKASQPLSFQSAARIFRHPRGRTADSLIEQAGLVKTKVGGAEVSDRNPNYIVAHPGATARDVLRLIDLIRQRVKERSGVDLELELTVW